ncbi:hypothetical protein FUT69_11460 [Xylella taiwanensis]|nr:hypothetical protein [Xylella taiwanensis]
MPAEIRTTSGVVIKANPDKTTTVLGTFKNDTDRIITELSLPKSMIIDGPTQPGSFNLLNTPDSLYAALGPEKFWQQVNKPFLDAAIKRGDDIVLATTPNYDRFIPNSKELGNIYRLDGTLTGFGREMEYLGKHGYVYDAATGKMVKP